MRYKSNISLAEISRVPAYTPKLEQARILYENSDHAAAAVCKIFGFSRRTFFNYLSETKAKQGAGTKFG